MPPLLSTGQVEAGDQLARCAPPLMVKCHHTHQFCALIPLQSSHEINAPNFSSVPPPLTLAQDSLSLLLGQQRSSALLLSLETSSPSLAKSLSHLANIYGAY